MSCSPDAADWVALGPPALLEMLVPLRDEHARSGGARLVEGGLGDVGKIARSLAGERSVLLLVGEAGGRQQFTSPFQETGDGEAMLGWLPLEGPQLADYVERSVAILRRREAERAVVLLAPREDRYLALLDEAVRGAELDNARLFRWSAERIRRTPLAAALRLGASAILYSGHGNATGWFAYGGLAAGHLAGGAPWRSHQSSALLFSLSCHTGAGGGSRRSFAEELVALGVAGAALAPLGDTLHENSRLLARALVDAIGRGRQSLPEILADARSAGASLDGYAVIGDPLLGVASAEGAATRGACVFAPAADAEDLAALRQACERAAASLAARAPLTN